MAVVIGSRKCFCCEGSISKLNRKRKCKKCLKRFCSDCCPVKARYPLNYNVTSPQWVCIECIPIIFEERACTADCEQNSNSRHSHHHLPWEKHSAFIDETFHTQDGANVHVPFKMFSPIGRMFFRASGMKQGKNFHRSPLKKAMAAQKILGLPSVGDHSRHKIQVPRQVPLSSWRLETLFATPPFCDDGSTKNEEQWGNIDVFVYQPKNRQEGEKLPVVVWYHGGGFCIGSMEDAIYEWIGRTFCNQIRCVVVSVDYRLAPEYMFPVQIEDAYWALQWVYEKGEEMFGIDVSRIVVAGDSAGGTLSAMVSIMSKLRGGPKICHQVLVYPCLANPCDDEYESQVKYKNGPLLTREVMAWMMASCLGDDLAEPSVFFPLLMDDKMMEGLPPATIINAGHDPLLDHGLEYLKKLQRAGVTVRRTVYSKSIHGFFGSQIGESDEAVMDAAASIINAFNKSQ